MAWKKNEVVYDSSSGLYSENYVVLKSFGGNEKMVQCGCGTIFFTGYSDKEIQCPTCESLNAVLDAVESLAKFAIDNGLEKKLEPIIKRMCEPLQEFDLHCEDQFEFLSKYWDKI